MMSQRLAAKLGPFIDDVRNQHKPFFDRLTIKYAANIDSNGPMIRRSRQFAAFYLWFMATTVLYTSLKFTIPYVVGEVFGLDSWVIYWCKVVVAFGFVQITANWSCVRCYDSYYEITEDRPDLRKTLWDDHPEENAAKVAEGKKHDETDDRGFVMARKIGTEGHGRWQYCPVCQRDTPPRAHHCKVCKKCTLKRDHHCFIVGTCIGYFNQRYFVVLVFYLMVYSVICLFLAYHYLGHFMWPTSTKLDWFLPYTFYQWIIGGGQPLEHFLIMCQLYTFVWCGPMSASFFCLQMLAIATGKTMYEFKSNLNLRINSGINENFRSVFGAFWGFNFLFPAVILFRQTGDGIHWPKVAIVIRRKRDALVEIKERSQ